MSKKNPITKIWIIRKNDSDTDTYLIGFFRKYGECAIRFYSDVSKTRTDKINKAAIFSNRYTQNAGFKNAHWHGKAYDLDTPKPKTQPLTVYFVQIGMDGYLPDSVSAYPTLKQAIRAAIEEKKISLESGWDDCRMKITGNIRKDNEYTVLTAGGRYNYSIRIVSSPASAYVGECDMEAIKTRADLETFCDAYNQNVF